MGNLMKTTSATFWCTRYDTNNCMHAQNNIAVMRASWTAI